MRDPQIWTNVTADNMAVVILKQGVLYGGTIQTNTKSDLEKKIEAGEDPRSLLGGACPRVPIEDITKAVANNVGDLTLESDGTVALKLPMAKAGLEIVETIQDAKGPGWEIDVVKKNRIGSALISMLIGIVMGGGMVWVYFGVVSGKIERIHWLAAIMINNLGAVSLLVLGALIFLGGMFGFGYYLVNPAEVWTLEED